MSGPLRIGPCDVCGWLVTRRYRPPGRFICHTCALARVEGLMRIMERLSREVMVTPGAAPVPLRRRQKKA
jgi:hypothetical protein